MVILPRHFGFLPRAEAALVLPSRGRGDEVRKILLRALVGPVRFPWRIGGEVVLARGYGGSIRDRLFPRAERHLSSRLPLVRSQLLDHGLQYLGDRLLLARSVPSLERVLLLQHVGESGLELGEAGRHGAHVALLRCLLLEDLEQGGMIGIEDRGFDLGLGAGRRCAAAPSVPIVHEALFHIIVARVLGQFLVKEVVIRFLQHLARQRLLGDGSDQSCGA